MSNYSFNFYTMKNPVVHFEMPYEDAKRLSKFYNQAFEWDMQNLGEEMGKYVMAHTTETDDNNMVKTPGNINGGFFPKSPEVPAIPSVVIGVPDINEAMSRVREAGGEILGEPMPIPGVGIFVSFKDTEGNRVSLIQGNQ